MGRLFIVVAVATLAFRVSGHGQITEAGGVVVIEAENFNANLSPRLSPAHSWTFGNSVSGFSGSGYMEATPNTGTPGLANSTTPELQFTVNFANTGTHYVWIRGYAGNTNDDSIFAGIDGGNSVACTLDSYNVWEWSEKQQGSANPPTIPVGTLGNHTINLGCAKTACASIALS
jgi:hypothetical protein